MNQLKNKDKIILDGIKKIYNPGDVTEMCLFNGFSLSVKQGEFVSVVGSNGSGKTSMLNIMCGSMPVDSGRVLIGSEDVTHAPEHLRYAKIGRVWQNPASGTCSELTILENMSLSDCAPAPGAKKNERLGAKAKIFGLSRGVSPSRISFYREQLSILGMGLENMLEKKAGLLSGGQRQALALIMSTLTPIDILILDEHTAALDPKTAERIMELTDKVVSEKALTAVMVTHNLRFAVDYGSRLLMMHAGEIVLDVAGEEKRQKSVGDLLGLFNKISIECGN